MAEFFAGKFICTVCNYFVCIHVTLCSRTCLPYNQWKMFVKFATDNFIACLGNSFKFFVSHFFRLQSIVCNCGSLFKIAESLCDFSWHSFNSNANFKIFVAAFCLGCPVFVSWNLNFAHRVMLNSVLSFFFHVFLRQEIFYKNISIYAIEFHGHAIKQRHFCNYVKIISINA